jgi:hypothetical protein
LAQIDDILNEQIRKKQFRYGAQLPISWKMQALKLKRASDKIFISSFNARKEIWAKSESNSDTLADHIDVQLISVYLLLMGFAIENLIKGLLFFQHPEYLIDDKQLSREVTGGHNLRHLFELSDWTFESKDKHWLECLSIYITWAGRYPIPLNLTAMLPKKEKDGTWTESFLSDDLRRDYEELDDLFERVMKKLSDVSDTVHHQLPPL